MEPTIEAELAAVRRILNDLASGGEVSDEVSTELVGLDHNLRLVERSWARRLPYLLADNGDLVTLLQELSPPPPADGLAREIRETVGALAEKAEVDGQVLDPAAADETNRVLRGLLARLIVESAEEDETRRLTVRRRVSAALAESLEERPW